MSKTTTLVITGAHERFVPFIRDSVRDLLQDEGFHVLRQRGAEEALAHDDRKMAPQEQFLIRDILYTQSHMACLVGMRRCLLMGCVDQNLDAAEFKKCESIVWRELDEVKEWGFFKDIGGACFTPRPEIVLLC